MEDVSPFALLGALASLLTVYAFPWAELLARRRGRVRVLVTKEASSISREQGFMEPAIKICVANESPENIRIRDIRLMFSDEFGVPVEPAAPPGFSHESLPVDLASAHEGNWYIPAHMLTSQLQKLHYEGATAELAVYPRCTTGTGQIHTGSTLLIGPGPDIARLERSWRPWTLRRRFGVLG